MTGTAETSLYQPGDTFLHRVDPRLKVCFSLLLVALSFAAGGWLQFLLPVLLVAVAVWIVTPLPAAVWRACWMMRWLVLLTLIMYLLFSEGRTLLGVGWLSLDGLLKGGQVCLQMMLAVVIASLLSVTTPVEQLVGSLGWFARPFHWLGCRTDDWQRILLLTIDFMPVVREEMTAKRPAGGAGERSEHSGAGRWSLWVRSFNTFIHNIITRGDGIAHRLAAEEKQDSLPVSLPGLLPLALHDQLFLALFALLGLAYWLVG